MSCGLSIERVYWVRVFLPHLGGIFGPFGGILANLGGIFSVFLAIFRLPLTWNKSMN